MMRNMNMSIFVVFLTLIMTTLGQFYLNDTTSLGYEALQIKWANSSYIVLKQQKMSHIYKPDYRYEVYRNRGQLGVSPSDFLYITQHIENPSNQIKINFFTKSKSQQSCQISQQRLDKGIVNSILAFKDYGILLQNLNDQIALSYIQNSFPHIQTDQCFYKQFYKLDLDLGNNLHANTKILNLYHRKQFGVLYDQGIQLLPGLQMDPLQTNQFIPVPEQLIGDYEAQYINDPEGGRQLIVAAKDDGYQVFERNSNQDNFHTYPGLAMVNTFQNVFDLIYDNQTHILTDQCKLIKVCLQNVEPQPKSFISYGQLCTQSLIRPFLGHRKNGDIIFGSVSKNSLKKQAEDTFNLHITPSNKSEPIISKIALKIGQTAFSLEQYQYEIQSDYFYLKLREKTGLKQVVLLRMNLKNYLSSNNQLQWEWLQIFDNLVSFSFNSKGLVILKDVNGKQNVKQYTFPIFSMNINPGIYFVSKQSTVALVHKSQLVLQAFDFAKQQSLYTIESQKIFEKLSPKGSYTLHLDLESQGKKHSIFYKGKQVGTIVFKAAVEIDKLQKSLHFLKDQKILHIFTDIKKPKEVLLYIYNFIYNQTTKQFNYTVSAQHRISLKGKQFIYDFNQVQFIYFDQTQLITLAIQMHGQYRETSRKSFDPNITGQVKSIKISPAGQTIHLVVKGTMYTLSFCDAGKILQNQKCVDVIPEPDPKPFPILIVLVVSGCVIVFIILLAVCCQRYKQKKKLVKLQSTLLESQQSQSLDIDQ